MIESTRYPTAAELDAMIASARQARAQALANLIIAAARGLKTLAARCSAALARARGDAGPSMHRSA